MVATASTVLLLLNCSHSHYPFHGTAFKPLLPPARIVKEEGLGFPLTLTMDGNMADGIPSSAHSMADGMRPDSLVASPSSSSGGASRQRQKQVPISRSTASGYERPERARTSHACEPCRERKTKCDGERPSCRRCLHTGTVCHYGYGKGWKKRKYVDYLCRFYPTAFLLTWFNTGRQKI